MLAVAAVLAVVFVSAGSSAVRSRARTPFAITRIDIPILEPQELGAKDIERFVRVARDRAKACVPLFTTLAYSGVRVREALAPEFT